MLLWLYISKHMYIIFGNLGPLLWTYYFLTFVFIQLHIICNLSVWKRRKDAFWFEWQGHIFITWSHTMSSGRWSPTVLLLCLWLTYISSHEVSPPCTGSPTSQVSPSLSSPHGALTIILLLFASVRPSAFGPSSQAEGPFRVCFWWTLRSGELQVLCVLGLAQWWKERRWTQDSTCPAQREDHELKLSFPSLLLLAWQIFKVIKPASCWYWPTITKNKILVGYSLTMSLFFFPYYPRPMF